MPNAIQRGAMAKSNSGTVFSPKVTINLIQRGDTIAGDYVGEKMEIKDSVIDQIVSSVQGESNESLPETCASATSECDAAFSSIENSDSSGKDAFFLEEKCYFMFRQRQFAVMKPLLEHLLPLQANFWNKLKTRLMIVEAEIYRGPSATQLRYTRSRQVIREVEKCVELVSPQSTATKDDIIQLAREYRGQNYLVRSLVLYLCSCSLHGIDSKSSVSKMATAFEEISCVVKELRIKADSARNVASGFCVIFMHESLEQLRALSGLEPSFKTEQEAICLKNIGKALLAAEEVTKAKQHFKEGEDRMISQFGGGASKYFVFGDLFFYYGKSCLGTNLKVAEDYFERARAAWQEAKNFESPEQKEEYLDAVTSRLEKMRGVR